MRCIAGGTRIAIVAGALALCAGCSESDDSSRGTDAQALAQRAERFQRKLAAPDSDSKFGGAVARWIMPDNLKEISGLTLTSDGRLFGHATSMRTFLKLTIAAARW